MFEFEFDKSEIYRVGWQLRQLSRPCRFMDRALFLAVPLIAFVVYRARLANLFLLISFVAGVIVWCIVAPWFHRKLSDSLLALKMFDMYRKMPASGLVEVEFKLSGVKWKSPYADRFTPWNKVRGIIVTTDYVFLRVSFSIYHWIPIRAFKDGDEFARLLSLLRERSGLSIDTKPLISVIKAQNRQITNECSEAACHHVGSTLGSLGSEIRNLAR